MRKTARQGTGAVYVVGFLEFQLFNWISGPVVSYVPVNSSAGNSQTELRNKILKEPGLHCDPAYTAATHFH